MILNFFKRVWEVLNRLSPENRNLIIILLIGYIFYFQMNLSTLQFIINKFNQETYLEKRAEQYTKDTAVELNRWVRLIADRDLEAYDVLLLSYHNSKQSLQGYKYLYLSCLTEAPRSLDTPLLKQLWNNIDYIYYADELTRIHNQSYVLIKDIELMQSNLPKLYHLVKASDAKAITFFTVEGKNSPIGMVVILYKECPTLQNQYNKAVLPAILKLSLLLDYENAKK